MNVGRMSVWIAVRNGMRRVAASRRLLVVLWLANVLVALPAALMMMGSFHGSFGRSLVSEAMRDGLDTAWYGEYTAEARGLEATFEPSVVGVGAVLDNLEAWWSGRLFAHGWEVVGLGGLFALLWALLLGGVLDQLLHAGGKLQLARFFWAGGRYFLRFVALAAMAGVLYYGVYRLARFLFGRLEEASRDVTRETPVFLWTLLIAGLTVLLLAAVRMVFDYAKIATVEGERRNPLTAAWEGLRFVAGRPLTTFGVVVAFAVLAAVLVGLYALVAPGPGQASFFTVLLAFLLGQLYLVAKIGLRVGLLGAEVELYGGSAA